MRDGRRLADAVSAAGWSVAVAESLTGGALSGELARLPDAGEWYRGAVVAYAMAVKHDVLGVPEGVPAVSEVTATVLADGVAALLGADVSIAVTGVGGPGPRDGIPAGTVWMAIHELDRTRARSFAFAGDPGEVVRQTCAAAVGWLADAVTSFQAPTAPGTARGRDEGIAPSPPRRARVRGRVERRP